MFIVNHIYNYLLLNIEMDKYVRIYLESENRTKPNLFSRFNLGLDPTNYLTNFISLEPNN